MHQNLNIIPVQRKQNFQIVNRDHKQVNKNQVQKLSIAALFIYLICFHFNIASRFHRELDKTRNRG